MSRAKKKTVKKSVWNDTSGVNSMSEKSQALQIYRVCTRVFGEVVGGVGCEKGVLCYLCFRLDDLRVFRLKEIFRTRRFIFFFHQSSDGRVPHMVKGIEQKMMYMCKCKLVRVCFKGRARKESPVKILQLPGDGK